MTHNTDLLRKGQGERVLAMQKDVCCDEQAWGLYTFLRICKKRRLILSNPQKALSEESEQSKEKNMLGN